MAESRNKPTSCDMSSQLDTRVFDDEPERIMTLLMDVSPKKLHTLQQRVLGRGLKLGQLRTPLTQYRNAGVVVGIDNGCFAGRFKVNAFNRIVGEHKGSPDLLFVVMPDVVGDARRTLELYEAFCEDYSEVPRALVAQDGIEDLAIPWHDLEAIFIGGTDAFKDSEAAMSVAKAARILGKHVHVGRVNAEDRLKRWCRTADTCDGSGLARYDHMFNNAVSILHDALKNGPRKAT